MRAGRMIIDGGMYALSCITGSPPVAYRLICAVVVSSSLTPLEVEASVQDRAYSMSLKERVEVRVH